MFPRNGLEGMKVFGILAQKEICDNCGLVLPLFRTSWALPVCVAAVERRREMGRGGGGEEWGIWERRKRTFKAPASLSHFSPPPPPSLAPFLLRLPRRLVFQGGLQRE